MDDNSNENNDDSQKRTEFSKSQEKEKPSQAEHEPTPMPKNKDKRKEDKRENDRDEDDHDIQVTDEIPPDVEELLHTDSKTGLSTEEAQTRLDRFGRNEISEYKQNRILKFLSYFQGSIAYLIEITCIVAAIVKDWTDFGIILALLFVNATIGFVEETRAESALDALKQSLALKTRVKRDGKLVELEAAELVPGDIVALRIGDIIPADCRLLGIGISGSETETYLNVDQSALTGESLPVNRKKGDCVFSSSTVKQGQMLAVVYKTGAQTYIGRAATLMNMTADQGHFQKIINQIGNFLILITVLLVTIIFVYQVVKFRNTPQGDVLVILQDVLVLTVAAIPVGLPTVLSVTMAVGAKQLASKKVIVKRLTAIEELASVSVLCSDKTGTMTLNELKFDEPWLSTGYGKSDILLYAYLCSEQSTNDAIEMAVVSAAKQGLDILKDRGDDHDHEVPGYKTKSFTPFNPSVKYSKSTVMNLETKETFQIVKGAPQVITKLADREDTTKVVTDLAKRGLRALGVARTVDNDPDKWELVGFICFLDPPRPDTQETIQKCKNLGVKIKMITGDQVIIAKEVAHRLGMGRVILDANHLADPNKSLDEITAHCERADGFAQVTPEHKFKVVELLQKKGYLVGMTGDGVNDAPALKKANVGIAVSGCTDAARSASDIVLLAPGLSTIVDGIITSRQIFQRMRSYALYRITSTIHFLLFFFFIILILDWKLPAILLILIAILNDAATIVISVDNAKISNTPDKWRIGQLITLSFLLGICLSGFSFAHYFIFKNVIKVTNGQLQTVMYLHISSAPHFMIFSTRLGGFFWENIPSVMFIAAILGTQIFALIISVFGWLSPKIPFKIAITILCISLGIFVTLDVVKVIVFKYWSFELTTILWPTPRRRAKLTRRNREREKQRQVQGNFSKLQKVLLLIKVIRAFRNDENNKKNENNSEKNENNNEENENNNEENKNDIENDENNNEKNERE
ncbi:hypothetical protein RclHR1_08850002 [Rhizophagus clarus]|uniref:Plasma membrane ATPase n=1 Tax=Rhizophagus clarus TaxID=94130 RepID=A0A2Z6SP77_9GLOM|nr:hypothetical protein RclHR1_08850002 [Rhizophagus clarus]